VAKKYDFLESSTHKFKYSVYPINFMVSKEELQKKVGKLLGQLIHSGDEYNKNESSLQQHYILMYSTFLFLTGIFISLSLSRLAVMIGEASLVFDLSIIGIAIICIFFCVTYFLKSRNSSHGLRALKDLKTTVEKMNILTKEGKKLKN